jgi:hypothetical protein
VTRPFSAAQNSAGVRSSGTTQVLDSACGIGQSSSTACGGSSEQAASYRLCSSSIRECASSIRRRSHSRTSLARATVASPAACPTQSWRELELHFGERSLARVSHGLCPGWERRAPAQGGVGIGLVRAALRAVVRAVRERRAAVRAVHLERTTFLRGRQPMGETKSGGTVRQVTTCKYGWVGTWASNAAVPTRVTAGRVPPAGPGPRWRATRR